MPAGQNQKSKGEGQGEKQCQLCKFFVPSGDGKWGECRIGPPVGHDGRGGIWRLTVIDDWCWAFQKK